MWLAEQARPVRRQVAVKILKAGMDTEQVIARFEAERQALALMEHPVIARIFDGGPRRPGALSSQWVNPGRSSNDVLRPPTVGLARAARVVHTDLRRCATCTSEGRHPPRSETIEHSGVAYWRSPRSTDHRLRHRQGDRTTVDRSASVHRIRRISRNPGVRPRAGRRFGRRRYSWRYLFVGRPPL